MADSAFAPSLAAGHATAERPRHAAFVRVTHWITALCFIALLISGVEILISHPRFYWGETGNVLMPALFQIPIPASRGSVPTGYNFVLKDQNGWSRSLHFQAAWLLFFAGLLYVLTGVLKHHFRDNLLPSNLTPRALAKTIASSFDSRLRGGTDAGSYNPIQRLTYLIVVFGLFPLMFWTGLAMSPGFVAGFPFIATAFGGQQSARTIHFFATGLLVVFLLVHVFMLFRAGFVSRTRAMITGRAATRDNG